MIINYARGSREVKFRISLAKATFNENTAVFHQQTGLKFKEETIRVPRLDHSFVWC